MESNRQLIEMVMHYSTSFRPISKPQTNLSQSYDNIHDSEIVGSSCSKWIDLVKTYCPHVLDHYPQQKYTKQYQEEVHLIQTQLKFKGSSQPDLHYTLIKSKKQVEHFKKQYNKGKHNEGKVEDICQILAHYSVADPKSKHKFEDFIEQIAPHQKWNIRVLGQYKVGYIEEGSVKSCMNETVCRPCQRFNKFYLTITNECILFSDETLVDGIVQEAIPYTYALRVEYKTHQHENFGHRFVVNIVSGKTQIQVAFDDLFDLLKFSYTFELLKKSLPYFTQDNEFQSFSPVRYNNWTNFYNDGASYFEDLHDQLQKAQRKICITGWCITPYLLLKRTGQGNDLQNSPARFDRTLNRAAKRGVKIFILVFQEPSLFVNNDSFNVWSMFENMNENFKVLRHPGLIIPQLWSHHEKMVIIDEKVAFMGGLDICYGRWDTHDHPLDDKNGMWEGADYNNERQRSITEPRRYGVSNLDRVNEPRMPWHDIAMQFKGPAVIDLQRHFCQYWYFAIRDLSDDPRDHLRNFKSRYDELKREERQTKEKQREKFYLYNKPNLTKQDQEKLQVQYAASANRKTDPNNQDYTFADRVRHAKQAFNDLVQNKQSTTSKQIIVQGFSVNDKPGNMKLNLCRSSCTWSTGIQKVQHSIYNAYLKLIKESKQFIYIENQFFMSYQNLISEEIADRILKAYEKGEDFKVIVMMPLLPGFEGDVTKDTSGVLRAQMQLQYEAISRSKQNNSILQIVQQKNPKVNIFNYIYFFGVRNHGLFGPQKNIPKTEIIYIHSKLMIVDDKRMIIGSANINDRSLLGSRDSELAMIIEDPKGSYGKGSIFQFRTRIFKEHFGMSESNCKDLSGYWNKLISFATKNTLIYRQVFGCYPDRQASRYSDVAQLEKRADPNLYWDKIDQLYGHYVEWPIDFLKDEDLSLKFGQKEFLAPITFFT